MQFPESWLRTFVDPKLSTDELETVTGGATIMSGVPNSMTTTFQHGPALPPLRWSGVPSNSAIHMAAF